MGKKIIKILVANDHSIMRDALKLLFEKRAPYIKIVGEASNFQEILTKMPEINIDILLMDDIMPGGDASTFLPLLQNRYPDLKIIIQTIFDPSAPHIKKVKERIEGLIGLTASEQEIISAIETVYCGGYYFNIKGYEKELS